MSDVNPCAKRNNNSNSAFADRFLDQFAYCSAKPPLPAPALCPALLPGELVKN
jgi:hypothetical protein